ncbi:MULTISPECIES: RNA polymerase recycling motor ATPase HelR [unclassified Gordonia (in: high G+C Gram-positive bacteria)]|uniref:RNA polymerase recycling motor ATPase HelR n=1 Tax=unclassified Gordonia (in: high G+C Gram-positive bacteria) TaxID=2657482 RepID=UPI001F114FDF|nr:RNA polymerase recycling motor ATPase HelR [Gordonia sp. ABSL49_1]MCH5641446.1 AAA family ATPase [Gordonia sp. ABSL49_1]
MPFDRPIFTLAADHPAHANPTLITTDTEWMARIAQHLEHSVSTLTARLDELRRTLSGNEWQEASDRDLEIRGLTSRLAVLRRHERDVCLGRFVCRDGSIVYIGRVGLVDFDGDVLLVDWRTPEAEPYFGATQAHPADLESRRRYRWSQGSIVDFWDEILVDAPLTHPVAPDDDSAFLATLSVGRSPRMRDVLGTIASDQDLAVRAPSQGALVVDGGPGTGKTVVALHRAAYLLYADERVSGHRGGVLVVGPHEPYLGYVADVLPNLGTDGVRLCTPNDIVAEGEQSRPERDPGVAHLKGSLAMVRAVERAVLFYEQPPSTTTVDTLWGEVTFTAADWSEAFDAAGDAPHNEAREHIWETLSDIAVDSIRAVVGDIASEMVSAALQSDEDLAALVSRSWPIVHATDIVGDLWTVPAFLRWCDPDLTEDQVRLLQRPDGAAWTSADLPLLDAARRRLGDPGAEQRRRRRAKVLAAQRAEMDDVVSHLISSREYDDGEGLMSMLRQGDLRDALVDESEVPRADPDLLAGPFAHIIVDEAQELADAQWHMLTDRCPSGSMTVVGDRAQARRGFSESWTERLTRIGLGEVRIAPLSVNYRTPAEIMETAEPIIRAALPDANVPTSIRRSGRPVGHIPIVDLHGFLDKWLADHPDTTACVIGDATFDERPRVRSLSPERVKGLEFDLVIVVRPEDFGSGITGSVDTYVAMTRATAELVIAR